MLISPRADLPGDPSGKLRGMRSVGKDAKLIAERVTAAEQSPPPRRWRPLRWPPPASAMTR